MNQPWLHDLTLCLSAPTQAWSGPDGQIRPGAMDGVYHADRRFLSQALLLVDGVEPAPVAHHDDGGDTHVFVSVPRALGDDGPDPTVRMVRRREVEPGLLREQLTLSSTARDAVTCEVTLDLTADLTPLDAVKSGTPGAPVTPSGLGSPTLTWSNAGAHAQLRLHHATTTTTASGLRASWQVTVPPGGSVTREVLLLVQDDDAAVAPARADRWPDLRVESADRRLAPVLQRCLEDLRLLRLSTPDSEDEFVAAGAPWFLTLFGRDSLWTARMLLPLTTAPAASTLRLLARHQGSKVDPETAEEPGKILHEVRSSSFGIADREGVDWHLPPVYYGTIDATPLWALTLHDAWRWGLAEDEVEPLLTALEHALAWMVDHGDADSDHLLEYIDASGHGLSNQGWKDSHDAVRRSDGTLATAPVALCEVQGYAYAAATRGADLLDAFGAAGTDRWREWAQGLRESFRQRFWVEDAHGSFPAIALDGTKRPVVSVTSNMGHLLGTGLLDDHEVDAVARRLTAPDMLTGFGIRTMSRDAAGYSPTGYHVGSVWPHDTAICLAGLAAENRPETGPVAEALLAALHAFEGRPPELFAGDDRSEHPSPIPYPAACRPQAWSAAAAVSLLASLTGLRPPATPGALPAVSPVTPWPLGATRVTGLRPATEPLVVDIDEEGAGAVHPSRDGSASQA